MEKFFTVLVLVLAVFIPTPCHGTARLLASKLILNEHAVAGKDLTVQYSIYNVGTSSAQNVTLTDESFSATEFELVHGLLSTSWERIPSKANITHTVILRPVSEGIYNLSFAVLTYQASEGGQEQTSYTSSPNYFKIASFQEFARKHVSHITEWIAFFLMSAPTILLPFFLWYKSHSKYEKLRNKRARD